MKTVNSKLHNNTIIHVFKSQFFVRYAFASASPDNIKQWKFPDGNFLQNLAGHNSIINCMAVNSDNVLVTGGMYTFYPAGYRNMFISFICKSV